VSSHSSTITVGAVMHRGVINCPSQMPMGGVAALMAEHSVHCVVVDGAKVLLIATSGSRGTSSLTSISCVPWGPGGLDAKAGEATANQNRYRYPR